MTKPAINVVVLDAERENVCEHVRCVIDRDRKSLSLPIPIELPIAETKSVHARIQPNGTWTIEWNRPDALSETPEPP